MYVYCERPPTPNAATLGRLCSIVARPCLHLVGVRHGYLGNHYAYFVDVQEWLVDFHVKRSERPHTQCWASRHTLWATITCNSGRASYIAWASRHKHRDRPGTCVESHAFFVGNHVSCVAGDGHPFRGKLDSHHAFSWESTFVHEPIRASPCA